MGLVFYYSENKKGHSIYLWPTIGKCISYVLDMKNIFYVRLVKIIYRLVFY